MINSSLFATINNSVSFLKEFLEKYNAVLPFAKISSKMANLLPFQIFEKRSFFRKKYHLLEDGFIKTNNENASFEENEKKYDEIISSVLEELYEGLISSFFSKFHFLYFKYSLI